MMEKTEYATICPTCLNRVTIISETNWKNKVTGWKVFVLDVGCGDVWLKHENGNRSAFKIEPFLIQYCLCEVKS